MKTILSSFYTFFTNFYGKMTFGKNNINIEMVMK